MDTKEKIKKIKIRLGNTRNIKEQNISNFGVKVQSYIDTIEKIKHAALDASQKGRQNYTVIENIFSVDAPAFGRTEAIIFANIPETKDQENARKLEWSKSLAIAVAKENGNELLSIAPDHTQVEIASYQITSSYKYECVSPSLLQGKRNPHSFNEVWYSIDTEAGKSVIKDDKLIELWELLEENELKPFFSGGDISAHLCVHI
ncbi:hypothetical protein AADZ86_08655 [Colwelliaceae bacterium BS250]